MEEPHADPSPLIGRKLGRFRVEAKLGQGGIASVWKATDELLGRTVALKILDESIASSPKARRRFVHEAQAVSRLDHPGIVTVYDAAETGRVAYIALTYVDGHTVSDLVAMRLLPLDEAVRIASAAAEALEHAHARGVIHRDVTGRNIMVANDGRVFVLDFGLALAAGMTRLTSSESGLGTVAYMAPEAITGRELDPRADVYGLGVVLFEALTGAFPFTSERPETMAFAKLNLPPRSVLPLRPDVPPALEHVVARALELDPARRYPGMGAMLEDLRAAATLLASSAPAPHEGPLRAGRLVDPRLRDAPSTGADAASLEWPDPMYLGIFPFAIQGLDADDEGVLDTIVDRIPACLRGALSGDARLRLVPVSIATPREPDEETRRIARAAGANAFLHGSIARSGTRLRVTFSLHDAWRGIQLAAGTADGSVLQPFDLEDEIAARVRQALRWSGTLDPKPAPVASDPVAEDRYRLGLKYLERHDNEASIDGAIAVLEQLERSNGEDARVHATLTRAYLAKFQLTAERRWEMAASRSCERSRELDPDAPEVALALGELWFESGRHDDARGAFQRALDARPADIEPILGLGRIDQARGEVSAAEALFRRAIDRAPEDWRGHSRLGRLLSEQGRLEEAIACWRNASRMVPDNASLDFNIGSALYHLDRFEDAIAAYERSLATHPRATVYSSLGTVLFYLGRQREALDAFERSVSLAPQLPAMWGNLGNAYYYTAGFETRAREPLQRAVALMREHLERHPREAKSWAKLASWLTNLDLGQDALQAIQRGLDLEPGNVDVLVRAGHVHFKLGDRKAALEWFSKAVERGYGAGELERDPGLVTLREDAEFRRMIREGSARGQGRAEQPGTGGRS